MSMDNPQANRSGGLEPDGRPLEWVTVSAADPAAIEQGLLLLVDAADFEPDEQLLEDVVRRSEAGPLPPWPQAILRAGADAGLNLAVHGATVSELGRESVAALPWLTFRSGASGLSPLVIRDLRGSRVEVQEPGALARWISLTELENELGAASSDSKLVWVSGEPAAPLDGLRSPSEGASLTPTRRLLALLASERKDLWVAVIYSIAVGLLSLVVPVAVQSLVNTVAFGSLLQPLVVLTLAVLAALGFSALLNGFRVFVIEIIQRRVYARVAGDTAYRLLRVKAEALDRRHGPELVNRFFDVVTVQKAAATLLMDGLSLLMQTVLGMVLLALYHPLLLAFDVFLILAIAVIIWVMGRGAIGTAIKESKAKYETAAWLEEMAAHLRTFKSGGAARFAMDRADRLARDYLDRRRSHFRIFLRQVIGSLALQAIASAALLGVGGFLVIDRQLTLGQLVAAELIVTVVVGGFSKFGKKFETYYDLLAAIDKLGALIDLPLERLGGEALPANGQGAAIQFRDVSFSYGPHAKVLEDANWEIEPGERIGLTGPSGAGKTAISDLLFGLRRPNAGRVTFDGIDLRDLCLDELREQVAVVHDAEVFSGTIAENVSLGRRDVDAPTVRQALAEAGLLEDIQALPDGLQTQLAMSGRPLSPGQVARLMLARAIAGRPRLLILDDAFDKIDDVANRNEICERLFAPEERWTMLIVSAHPDVLARCDRVFRLENGELTLVPQERLA